MRFGDHISVKKRTTGEHSNKNITHGSIIYPEGYEDDLKLAERIYEKDFGTGFLTHKVYAGIGSRSTPDTICQRMRKVAKFMARHNWTLRSGGAKGADSAFELGCDDGEGKKEIYLPHKAFNGNKSPLFTVDRKARLLAKLFHPNWSALGPTGRDFMGRNAYQILSPDLDTPVSFVLCWTPEGKGSGGTGQAIRMANHFRIPVFDLGSQSEAEVSDSIQEIMERI